MSFQFPIHTFAQLLRRVSQDPVPASPPTPTPFGQVGPGDGLTPCNKSRPAPYFPGLNLDKIRVHFGFPTSAKLAGAILDYVGIQTLNDARAIAIANDIYFSSKEVYNPDSISGIADIGHEITHVAQSGRLSFSQYVSEYVELRRQGLSDYDAYRFTTAEREAFKPKALSDRI